MIPIKRQVHLLIKYNNSTDQLTSVVGKILTDNTIIIYKFTNKKQLQIQEAICIKTNINEISFNTGTNILNIFNN